MTLGIVCIITAAKKAHINLVFAARGLGPETFTRALCAINPAATFETPATHYLMSDAGGDEAELSVLQAMTGGDLPDLPDGAVWGEGDVISAGNAMAACDGAVFHVYSAAGDIEPTDHATAVLVSEGLQFVPAPPL
jgi:hypothetical protein